MRRLRSRARRGAGAVLLAVVAVALAACAGLPMSGSVQAGLPPGASSPPDFGFLPDKPQPGASPEQIVEGFIRAGSGPDNNWATARLYLAPRIRETWNPDAGVTVDLLADRKTATVGDDKVTMTVTAQATVDATGVYTLSSGGPTPLSFSLAKVDRQWRITSAPDGIVIDSGQFQNVYHQYSVMYFDPSWRYLVPDLRWFPSTNVATRIVRALVSGKPSPWLASAVASAFPANVGLDHASVPIVSGVAQVELSGSVLSVEPGTLNRMQTQLEQSLQTAGVSQVQMSYGGTELSATAVAPLPTRIDARPLIATDKGFGFLGGTELETIPGLSEAVTAASPQAVQVSANHAFAAVQAASGAVLRVQSDRKSTLLDARPGLVDPVLDPQGYIWSLPAGEPSALNAYAPDGQPVSVAVGATWAGATRIAAMSLSRDGTRLAAVATAGGQSVAWVAGIVRTASGAPQSLGEVFPIAVLPGPATDITWLDDATVGIVASDGSDTVEIEQRIGGPAVTTDAPSNVTTIAGSTLSFVRLLTADGTLYAKRGSNWEQAASGVKVLATQQGSPQ